MKERLVYIMENIYLDGSVGVLEEDIAIGQETCGFDGGGRC